MSGAPLLKNVEVLKTVEPHGMHNYVIHYNVWIINHHQHILMFGAARLQNMMDSNTMVTFWYTWMVSWFCPMIQGE
jgi:hypothetical protein